MARIIIAFVTLLVTGLLQPTYAATKDDSPCPRPADGSQVLPPPDLFSSNGELNVSLNYYTAVAPKTGITLFCFETPDNTQSPTLNVNPGDTINITLTNMVPGAPGAGAEMVTNDGTKCGSKVMTDTSVNMHFHGLNVAPRCHSDEVIHTLVSSGQTFTYKIKIPKNEPPGLYWYHPHVHGIASPAVQGGATGAIIVQGIENIQPAVAGLPQRLLIIRDQPLGPVKQGTGWPFWDLSTNYVADTYPRFVPAVIKTQAGSKEFWRVANASANSILDLQLMYDGTAQKLQVVGFDGVPTGSQDGKRQGTIVTENHLLIPPAGRVEFIAKMPDASVKEATLVTNHIDSGPSGDYLPARTLDVIQTSAKAPHLPKMPVPSAAPHRQRFEDLSDIKPTAQRKLFFYEVFLQSRQPPQGKHNPSPPPDKDSQMQFYITVDGQQNKVFDPNNPPAIVTTRGAVEDWTIENRTTEDHEFHMHQIHFLLMAIDGKPVPKNQRQFYDTFPVKYGDGIGPDFPSITVRMDFRGAVTGNFVYHCHILDHEDFGMMAIIQVNPPGKAAKHKQVASQGGGAGKQVHAAK